MRAVSKIKKLRHAAAYAVNNMLSNIAGGIPACKVCKNFGVQFFFVYAEPFGHLVKMGQIVGRIAGILQAFPIAV